MRDLRAHRAKDVSGLAQLFGIDDLLIAGGLSLAGSLIGGSSAKSAAKSAANASQYATDQNTQLQREVLQLAQENTAVPRAAGNLATNALAARFGLIPTGSTLSGNIYSSGAAAPQGGAASGTPNVYSSNVPYSPPAAGSPDWQAVFADRPDVAAAVNNPNGGFNGATPQERAADWYARYGQAESYKPPTISASQASAAAPVTDVKLSPAAQVPTYTRPTDMQAPAAYVPNVYTPQTYTPQTYNAPTYERPAYDQTLDVSYDAYANSPEAMAAEYDINQQSGAAGSALAASGALKSGAAAKRLQQIGQDNKVKYYSDFRNYTTNQYNTDRARADNIYNFDTGLKAQLQQAYDTLNSGNAYNYANLNSNNAFNYAGLNSNNALQAANLARSDYQYGQNRADNIFNLDRGYGTDLALNNRAYETGRYDTMTGNLFKLANLGQGAAANYTSAAQNSANNQANALFSNAANQGNAALTSAAQFNNLLGSGLSAIGYALGNRSNASPTSTTRTSNIYGPSV